jgi:acyl-CoA thioester hydrolase
MTAGNGKEPHRVSVRWQDVDALGHVNNAVLLTYFEEGRDAWLAGHGIGREEYVVGRCNVSFHREVRLDTVAVTTTCATLAVGTKSVTTRERLTDDAGELLAEGEFALVLWDPERRATRAVTEIERASLARAMEEEPS